MCSHRAGSRPHSGRFCQAKPAASLKTCAPYPFTADWLQCGGAVRDFRDELPVLADCRRLALRPNLRGVRELGGREELPVLACSRWCAARTAH